MIALSFETGTRETSTLPLTDPVGGVSLVDPQGVVVTLTLRWPDDPAVVRPRGVLLATQAMVESTLLTEAGTFKPDNDPETAGRLLEQQQLAITNYAVALVCGWSVAQAFDGEGLRSLIGRAPFVRDLIVAASGEADRFLPGSLRPSRSASDAPSEAVA